jgi:nucleoside-diphosphate-sugar epimerase
MKILVTEAIGFLGSRLIEKFLEWYKASQVKES